MLVADETSIHSLGCHFCICLAWEALPAECIQATRCGLWLSGSTHGGHFCERHPWQVAVSLDPTIWQNPQQRWLQVDIVSVWKYNEP